MDAPTVIAIAGLALTSGAGLVSVTLYAANTKGIALRADHKARGVETAQGLHIAKVERDYVRKDALGPEIQWMKESLHRIEAQNKELMTRMMGGGV